MKMCQIMGRLLRVKTEQWLLSNLSLGDKNMIVLTIFNFLNRK